MPALLSLSDEIFMHTCASKNNRKQELRYYKRELVVLWFVSFLDTDPIIESDAN